MLLDTCALLWLSTGGSELSRQTRQLIQDAESVYVSAISSFEIAHKYARGGIELPCDPERWFSEVLRHHDIIEIRLDSTIAIASTKLSPFHKDPCDRFIIATALLNNLPVVTGDPAFTQYGIEVLC